MSLYLWFINLTLQNESVLSYNQRILTQRRVQVWKLTENKSQCQETENEADQPHKSVEGQAAKSALEDEAAVQAARAAKLPLDPEETVEMRLQMVAVPTKPNVIIISHHT